MCQAQCRRWRQSRLTKTVTALPCLELTVQWRRKALNNCHTNRVHYKYGTCQHRLTRVLENLTESGKVSVKVTYKMRPGGRGDVSQGEESVRYGKWGGTVHLEVAGTKAWGKEGPTTRINMRWTESETEASRGFMWGLVRYRQSQDHHQYDKGK